jgi:hypothetical protein
MGETPELIFAAGTIGVETIDDDALWVPNDYELLVIREFQLETFVRLHLIPPASHPSAPS